MGKSVQSVKNSLKFKADEKQGLLTIRYGVKKFVVPHAARMISDGKYMFLSFNASSELYEVKGKSLVAMEKTAEADDAYEALNPSKPKRGTRKARTKVSLAPELEAALRSIPAGYKLGYGADGSVKLVKSRVRRKKNG
ncbi:MAG TPA: hypothetical protein VK171_03355 [Fimbriimonas sp.]|nr:hypothetical protein [Fimbriimonas sp.]